MIIHWHSVPCSDFQNWSYRKFMETCKDPVSIPHPVILLLFKTTPLTSLSSVYFCLMYFIEMKSNRKHLLYLASFSEHSVYNNQINMCVSSLLYFSPVSCSVAISPLIYQFCCDMQFSSLHYWWICYEHICVYVLIDICMHFAVVQSEYNFYWCEFGKVIS